MWHKIALQCYKNTFSTFSSRKNCQAFSISSIHLFNKTQFMDIPFIIWVCVSSNERTKVPTKYFVIIKTCFRPTSSSSEIKYRHIASYCYFFSLPYIILRSSTYCYPSALIFQHKSTCNSCSVAKRLKYEIIRSFNVGRYPFSDSGGNSIWKTRFNLVLIQKTTLFVSGCGYTYCGIGLHWSESFISTH